MLSQGSWGKAGAWCLLVFPSLRVNSWYLEMLCLGLVKSSSLESSPDAWFFIQVLSPFFMCCGKQNKTELCEIPFLFFSSSFLSQRKLCIFLFPLIKMFLFADGNCKNFIKINQDGTELFPNYCALAEFLCQAEQQPLVSSSWNFNDFLASKVITECC